MTPKEKAKQLYDKMKFEAQFNSQPSTVHGMCKKLALICVDEIIYPKPRAFPTIRIKGVLNSINDNGRTYCNLQYWLDVKQELETL